MNEPVQIPLPLFDAPEAPAKALRRLIPATNSPEKDLWMTPDYLAQAIVDHYAPRGRLLEPCCGDGAFVRALQRYSNDVRTCEISEGRDFFSYHEPVDVILTNPPWSKIHAFLLHAMSLAPTIIFLCCMGQVTALTRRNDDIRDAGFGVDWGRIRFWEHPPPPWPRSGFQLATVVIGKGIPMIEYGAVPLPLLDESEPEESGLDWPILQHEGANHAE